MGVILFTIPILIVFIIGISFLQMKLLSSKNKLYGWIFPILAFLRTLTMLLSEYENFQQAIKYFVVTNIILGAYFLIIYLIHKFKNKVTSYEYSDVELYYKSISDNSPTNTSEYYNKDTQPSISKRTRLNSVKSKAISAILVALLLPLFMILYFSLTIDITILIPFSFIFGLIMYILIMNNELKEVLGSKAILYIAGAIISSLSLGGLTFMAPFLVSVVFILNTSKQIMIYYRNNPNSPMPEKKPFPIKKVLIVVLTIVIAIIIGSYALWTSYFKEDPIYHLNSVSVSSPSKFIYQNEGKLYDERNDITYNIEVVNTDKYYLDLIENEIAQTALDKNIQDYYSLASRLAGSDNVNVMTISVVTYDEDGTIATYDQIYYDIIIKKLQDNSFEAVSFFQKNGFVVKMVAEYSNEENRDLIHDEFENFIDTSRFK